MNRIRHNSPSLIHCLRAFHILFFAYLWWQWDIHVINLMYVLVINLRVMWPWESMHRGWHTFSSWLFELVYRQDLEYYTRSFKMDLQEAVFDEKVFCENLGPRSWRSQAGGAKPQDTGDSPRSEGLQDHGSCQGCWNPEVWNAAPEY